MNKFTRIFASMGVAAVLVGGSATVANAVDWGGTPEYCSPSIGCIGQYGGKNIYAPTTALSAYERQKLLECNLQLSGALVGAASRSWTGIGAAIASGGAALAGPCADLWNSTSRFR
ncbi:hypothetical protein [Paenarthrobacter nitroguajacolicus]|uniref:hypothetical protein n=1 Tax=Paenarthrobacter nitroguajacolicus TaxID=211146 RepID=UPI004054027D